MRVEIRRLRDAHVADPFAIATKQAIRIRKEGTEVKAQVDPVGVRRGEHERVAGPLREREVVGDGIHFVDELAGFGSLFEDQSSRRQCELLNHFPVRQKEFEVLRIGRTLAHSASVPHNFRGSWLHRKHADSPGT